MTDRISEQSGLQYRKLYPSLVTKVSAPVTKQRGHVPYKFSVPEHLVPKIGVGFQSVDPSVVSVSLKPKKIEKKVDVPVQTLFQKVAVRENEVQKFEIPLQTQTAQRFALPVRKVEIPPVQEIPVSVQEEPEKHISIPHEFSQRVRRERQPVFRSLFTLDTLKELGKFAAVSAVSFVVVLLVMNFSAYYQMASYWLDKWKGQTTQNTKNLETLVDGKTATDYLKVGQIGIPFLPTAGSGSPVVDLEVMPPDNRIVLPKIGKNVPIVEVPDTNLIAQNWKGLEEDIQAGLKTGVVHYPGTALPGQVGNFFLTGHSSYYFWEHSKYKDIFALLPEMEIGDQVVVYYNQKKYTYEITDKKTVSPSDTEVLRQTDDKRITMMTCVPVGTDLNRLILVGKLVETK
jgi:sortase A